LIDDDMFVIQLGRDRMATPTQRQESRMNKDPDPFELGQRAARENIPADGNPYQDGSQEHALWAAGHEQTAGEAEANEGEGT
jgi:hypothetical protein